MIRKNENYETQGKTIRGLIEELKTFENQELEVRLSVDAGETHYPISIVGKESDDEDIVCVLKYVGKS